MIRLGKPDRPGDKTLADLIAARPELVAAVNTPALAVREGARAS